MCKKRVLQATLGFVLFVVLTILATPQARADDCGNFSDCFGSTEAAVAALVAAAVLIGILIGLPALLGAATAVEEAAVVVTVESAIERGLVKSGSDLANILQGIQNVYASGAPQSLMQALNIVRQVTSELGRDIGVAPDAAKTILQGYIELENKGSVITKIFDSGEIIIRRGSDILLHLFP